MTISAIASAADQHREEAIARICTRPYAEAAENLHAPNVVVILADDLGYADVGFQGCKDIATPHLDALAKGGVICTDAYVSCPVCAPTRAGILTGRYQQRFGFEYNPGLGGDVGLPVTESTVADLLKSAGYVAGAIGKWHLGKEPRFQPLQRGFSEFYGFLGGGRPYLPINPAVKIPLAPNDPLLRGNTQIDDPEYLTDGFGQEAVAFIDRHKQASFFLYLAFNAVHVPLQGTEKYLNRFPHIVQQGRRTYAAMLSAMDDAVGRIHQKLQVEGLEHDTLIFFLSDNGGHPMANAARNDPLRGQKATVFEGGIRVPFVVKWTGHLPVSQTYSQPVSSLDILPTALAAAGIEASSNLHLDGVNLIPHLTGKNLQPPHDTLYWRYGNDRAIRHGKWKLTMPADSPVGLYDLSTDVTESKDLSATHREVVEELTRLFARWNSELQPPRWRDLWNRTAPGPVPEPRRSDRPSRSGSS